MELTKAIHGGLMSLICGDALGVLAVGYSRQRLIEVYGKIPDDLMIPVPSSIKRTKWNYRDVTDDTFQTLVVADIILGYSEINTEALVKRFISLPMKYAKLDSSTGRLRENADPKLKRFSISAGGAMRISPIGMVYSIKQEYQLVNEILKATQITHNSKSALGGAAAVAFAISAIIEGCKGDEVIEYAIRGSRLVEPYGEDDGFPSIGNEIETACAIGYKRFRENTREYEDFGNKTIESVPFVLSICSHFWDATKGILTAIEYGGDADTIASMVGAICGTYNPETTPLYIAEQIEECKKVSSYAHKMATLRGQIHDCTNRIEIST